MFDLIFPAHGFIFRGEAFVIEELHGGPGPGVAGSFFAVVGIQAFLQVVGPAGVQCAVAAFYDVGIVHGLVVCLSICRGRPARWFRSGSPVIYVKQSAEVDHHIEEDLLYEP